MPTVTFHIPERIRTQPGVSSELPDTLNVQAEVGANLLELAQDHHLPIEAKCGGNCACTTCHVYVLRNAEGNASLPPAEVGSDEEFMLEDLYSFRPEQSRLACQCLVPEAPLAVELAGE